LAKEGKEPMPQKSKKKWVAKVKTDSTHPPPGLFTKSASTIARALASRKVSPKGPGSGMRTLTYFINRAGKGLAPKRRAELKKAKSLLSKRIKQERESKTQGSGEKRRRKTG
jgi:tRNA(adenine34) deaminase